METAVAWAAVSVAVCFVWRGMLRDCFTSAASLSIHFTLSSFPHQRVHGRPLVATEDCFLRRLTLIVLGFPYLTLHPFHTQDCVSARSSLEGKLARLLAQNHELEDELASWRLHGGPDPGLIATLGMSDFLLSVLLAGGVIWRHHYGPTGPIYPVDRYHCS